MQNEHVIVCGGIKPSAGATRQSANSLALDLWGLKGASNVTLRIEDIHNRLMRDVPPVFQDLIEIATYVYCADQAISRGGIDVETIGGQWRRGLRFHIPVRCPEFWGSAQVVNCLRSTLEFLSDDNFEFNFYPATGAPGIQKYLELTDAEAPQGQPEQVVMYSGGLDSLSGAVQESIVEKRRIVLVNHRPTPKLNVRMLALQNLLAEKAGALRPTHLRVRIHKSAEMNREYTQRTRSFLYVSIGTTVAKMLGLNSLRFYENGIVSLNLPVCAQVVGGRATRTTHPRTLQGFQELLTLVAGQPFTVENRFVWETKGEIIQRIMKADCGSLIAASTSCAHTWESTKAHSHCGTCSQCIDRRMGIIAAQAMEFDPNDNYKSDVFTESIPKDEDKTMVATYLERANRIRAMRDSSQLIEAFPEVARALKFLGPNTASVAERVFDLHQRHAKEVAGAVKYMLAKNTDQILQRTLPGDCMLRIVYESNSVVSLATPQSVSREAAKPVTTLEANKAQLDAIEDKTDRVLKHVQPLVEKVDAMNGTLVNVDKGVKIISVIPTILTENEKTIRDQNERMAFLQQAITSSVRTALELVEQKIVKRQSDLCLRKLTEEELLLFLFLIGYRWKREQKKVFSKRNICWALGLSDPPHPEIVSRKQAELENAHPAIKQLIAGFRALNAKGEKREKHKEISSDAMDDAERRKLGLDDAKEDDQ